MNLREHARLMARYHGWAFGKVLDEVARLSDEEYRRDRGLFFSHIHGTLNHLLLVDLIWHGRLVGQVAAFNTLRDEIEADRQRLAERLLARDRVWLEYLDGLSDADLAGIASYRMLDGTPRRLPRASCILHVFNHGTHHRGQISTALSQAGGRAPEMDLPYFLYTLSEAELGLA